MQTNRDPKNKKKRSSKVTFEDLKVRHHHVDLGFAFTDFKVQGVTVKKGDQRWTSPGGHTQASAYATSGL